MNDERIRVLLIDDDLEDAHLIRSALRKTEHPYYEIEHVCGLPRAFRFLEAGHFDIVLLDLGLSLSNGVETLNLFRRHNDAIPVVVISGVDDEEVGIRALEHHAQDYLFKTEISSHNLSRSIRYAIQRQSSVSEIRRLLARVSENKEVLRRKNERLRTLYEAAHSFVDNVSHEFRTPLAVIKEYVSLVEDGTVGKISSEQRRFLSIAEDRADDLNTMVDDMLDVSKLESGLLCVRRKPYDVQAIINRVIPSLSRKSLVRDLTLDIQLPNDLPKVFCDREKAERVIINLVVNAMKFAKPGGRVTISAYEEQRDVVLAVKDTGPGIPQDRLKSIFERFQQLEGGIRSSTKGFGLGLNIAKELVELNLGRIRVDSELGVGSTFSFTVPKADPLDITQRYLTKMVQTGRNFASIVVATVPDETEEALADDADVFLSHLVRGQDLLLRTQPREWILVLPEPASEARLFLARAARELEQANRNRPRGHLPNICLQVKGSWSELSTTTDELTRRVKSLVRESEVLHV